MQPETVFDGAHLRAFLFPGRRDRLIVTFDHRQTGRTAFSPATHSTTFARQGYSQLSIKTRVNDWFVNPETPALEAVLRRVGSAHGTVQMLGYSMGGYAALRFAAALGARTAVLVSPQVSIAPEAVPFDPRYRAEGRVWDAALGDLGARAHPALAGVILADPFVAPDLRHARMIQALFPRLLLARLGFGGHPAIRVLRSAGKAWLVQREAARDRPDGQAVRTGHRAARRGSAGYWDRLAARAGARRPALAAAARARAALLDPVAGDAGGAD